MNKKEILELVNKLSKKVEKLEKDISVLLNKNSHDIPNINKIGGPLLPPALGDLDAATETKKQEILDKIYKSNPRAREYMEKDNK